MKKNVLLALFASSLFTIQVSGQLGPADDYHYGGSGNDFAFEILATPDGGNIMIGYTESTDIDITDPLGTLDMWVVKTFSDGTIDWQKTYGGSDNDKGRSIVSTTDGGYLLVGATESIDGDVVGNHGINDGWALKIDASGNIEWQRAYGGTLNELFNNAIATSDGGYLLMGYQESTDGDCTGNNGVEDFWIVKIANDGSIDWQKNYGGSMNEVANGGVEFSDGYMIVGDTRSADGDVTGNHIDSTVFYNDYWVMRIDFDGNLDWEKCYGGYKDDFGRDVIQSSDGNFLVAGSAKSADGDPSSHYGGDNRTDGWVVKLDEDGNIISDKNYGGSANDEVYSIVPDLLDGYIIVGESKSNDNDVLGHHGSSDFSDYWVLKFLDDYSVEFSISLGGTLGDVAQSILPNGPEDYTVVGFSRSVDDDVSGHYDEQDYWIINLGPCAFSITEDPEDVTACEGQDVTLTVGISGSATTYSWVFIGGPTQTTSTNSLLLEGVTTLYSSNYFVIATGPCGSDTSETATLEVTPFAAPDISPSIETSICTTGFIIFSTTASGVGYTYQWYKDGIAVVGATTSTYVATASGVYFVAVGNTSGCSAESIPVTVTNEGPAATITTTGSTNICATGTVTLSTITGAGYTYQWYKDAVAIVGATTFSYLANAVGNYYVIVDAAGCASTSSTVVVTNEGPVATTTALGSLDICLTGSVTLNSTTTGSGLAYQWLNNNILIAGALGVSLIATDTGHYSLQVINISGCKDTSAVQVVINTCLSVDDALDLGDLFITPNPADENLHLMLNLATQSESIMIEIYNLQGVLIYAKKYQSTLKIEDHFDLKEFSSGSYFMKISNDQGFMLEQFIIQH